MDPQTLQFDATPEQFQALRAAFEKQGVDIPDEAAGEIDQSGVRARFTFDGKTLDVTVYEKPFVFPQRVVMSRLKEFIEGKIA